MNWGYKIAIVTLSFVAFMTFLVVSAFRQNFDLVAEDYYKKEIQFQEQIEKQNNQQQLKEPLFCTVTENNVIVKFPDELLDKKIEGEILFFRPSDAKKDFKKSIAVSPAGIQLFTHELFSKGFYHVQIDYRVAGKKYYFEKSITIL